MTDIPDVRLMNQQDLAADCDVIYPRRKAVGKLALR